MSRKTKIVVMDLEETEARMTALATASSNLTNIQLQCRQVETTSGHG
jgi:hypothetical protein